MEAISDLAAACLAACPASVALEAVDLELALVTVLGVEEVTLVTMVGTG
ncbi:MAG: hypothetical protein ACO22V_06235 [Hylemonella sp.]